MFPETSSFPSADPSDAFPSAPAPPKAVPPHWKEAPPAADMYDHFPWPAKEHKKGRF